MSNGFVLMTDDSCDLTFEFLREHDVEVMQLSYSVDSSVYKAYDVTPKEFYKMLRDGKMPVTAQVSMGESSSFMESFLKDGRDVLYLAFSSGLSGTCNSAIMAAAELGVKYPDRKVVVVDTLAASMGQGLMIYKAIKMRDEGKTLDEIAGWAEENRDKVAHLVAVDDLMHLHRGGRVSKVSAIAGSMLGIKPIIHVDNEGHLIVIDKVRGRKQALSNLVTKMAERVGTVQNDIFMISHADCQEDADYLAGLVSERFGIKDYMINYIGPVIGSHTGPGCIALFLMAEHK